MCGIVGIFIKNKNLQKNLGTYLSQMLENVSSRGHDSAGFAVYKKLPKIKEIKYSLRIINDKKLNSFLKDAKKSLSISSSVINSDHIIVTSSSQQNRFIRFLEKYNQIVSLIGYGKSLEIYKQVGHPKKIIENFNLFKFSGTHAIGHTRMATESAVTTDGSHPYSTGEDECLVHNGSLSNHNNLRRQLVRKGKTFKSQNDTEVAAAYISTSIAENKSIEKGLKNSLSDLDGFYTFILGTRNGFTILRDEIACKPAIVAENNDYVAIASEFQAMANLPNVNSAKIFEPKPGVIYTWGK